jgi:hypothetical protein
MELRRSDERQERAARNCLNNLAGSLAFGGPGCLFQAPWFRLGPGAHEVHIFSTRSKVHFFFSEIKSAHIFSRDQKCIFFRWDQK